MHDDSIDSLVYAYNAFANSSNASSFSDMKRREDYLSKIKSIDKDADILFDGNLIKYEKR